jgi:hypothetical protein
METRVARKVLAVYKCAYPYESEISGGEVAVGGRDEK